MFVANFKSILALGHFKLVSAALNSYLWNPHDNFNFNDDKLHNGSRNPIVCMPPGTALKQQIGWLGVLTLEMKCQFRGY